MSFSPYDLRYLSLTSGGKLMNFRVSILLFIAFSTLQPALSKGRETIKDANMVQLAEVGRKRYIPDVSIYSTCISILREKYLDEAVFAAFDAAEGDTKKLLEELSKECIGSTHSSEWVTHCQNAVIAAKKENWVEARNQLSIALGLKRDLQDWLLMKAVADHKTGALAATVEDLENLCKIRKEKTDGYKTVWATERGVEENPLNSYFLKSYSKL